MKFFEKLEFFHTLFSKSAIIYKEIPINRNFRLTSFEKKYHKSNNIETGNTKVGKKVRNRLKLNVTKF